MAHDQSAPRTKRVRIGIVIDPDGNWEAAGSFSWDDLKTRDCLDDNSGDLGRPPWGYHWVEADIPIPAEQSDEAIEGEVTSDAE